MVSAYTPRERQVLRLVGRGFSNKEIARELRLEVGTVKAHLSSAMRRKGMTWQLTRTELAIKIARGEIVP